MRPKISASYSGIKWHVSQPAIDASNPANPGLMAAQFPHAAFALAGGRARTSFGDLNGGANDAVLQPDDKIIAVGFQAYYRRRKACSSRWRATSRAERSPQMTVRVTCALTGPFGPVQSRR